jgi:hypothetical protein
MRKKLEFILFTSSGGAVSLSLSFSFSSITGMGDQSRKEERKEAKNARARGK